MTNQYHLSASLLSASWLSLGQEAERMLSAGADSLHLDIMDHHFVPNLSLGPKLCHELRQAFPKANLEVHLMVTEPDPLIRAFASSGANTIYVHPECSPHLHRSLELIRSLGCEAGLVINPATSLSILEHTLDEIKSLLLMTVNPGFAGQKLIDTMYPKITKARKMIADRAIKLAIDGGVNANNIAKLATHGANTFIAGSALFCGNDYVQQVARLRQALADPK